MSLTIEITVPMPSPFIRYIQNEQHYTEVISRVVTVKQSLWIGTADIKDLYVMKGKEGVPFLCVLADLLKKGIDVRLIHAKEPGAMFREDFDRKKSLVLFPCFRIIYYFCSVL